MNFETFEEIISFAIENEKEAAAFYTDCAAKEPFASMKEALLEFAEEEKKHQSMLENLGKNKELIENYKLKWIRSHNSSSARRLVRSMQRPDGV